MTKPEPARYRTTDWSCGNAALQAAWLAADLARKNDDLPRRIGDDMETAGFLERGDPVLPVDKVLFRLPLGQTAGLVASPLCLNRFNALGNT